MICGLYGLRLDGLRGRATVTHAHNARVIVNSRVADPSEADPDPIVNRNRIQLSRKTRSSCQEKPDTAVKNRIQLLKTGYSC